ncbi:MAG: hypothetical protein JWN51_1744, partial [Phycisphaerales bacterium]|nr:hypothetical protein [Phycisphaerales bacterium]
ACEHLGRHDEALAWVRKGLTLQPGDGSLQRLELRIRVLKWRGKLVRGVRRMAFWVRPGRKLA